MKAFFVALVLSYLLGFSDAGNTIEHVGCHKVSRLENRCSSIINKENQKWFSANITDTIAKGVEWLRQKYTTTSWVDEHTSAWLAQSLLQSGYVNDGGNQNCSSMLTNEMRSLNMTSLLAMPAGRLAMVMIGLKATCSYDNMQSLNKHQLVVALRDKMTAFPQGEFNNFYQYSLAIIAMHVSGEQILDKFGSTLLRGVFIGKNKTVFHKTDNKLISDTEALGLIALKAVTKQMFMGHWTRKHALREQEKAKAKLDYILQKETNFVTLLHVLQAVDISSKSYCESVLNDVMRNQSKDGSYKEQLMTTSYAISVLAGKSILDWRELQCPRPIDKVDSAKIHAYTTERRKALEKNEKLGKIIPATVQVQINIPGFNSTMESVKINTREGESALDALRVASNMKKCFQFTTKRSSWGDYITHLCGVDQNHVKKIYWSYFVNGKSATVGAANYKMKSGDVITFRLKQYKVLS